MIQLWIKAALVAGSVIVGLGSVYLLKMKPDNPIEEVAEDIIKKETGVNIDLTPFTDEDKAPAGNDKPAGETTETKK